MKLVGFKYVIYVRNSAIPRAPGLHHQLIYSRLLAETIEQWLETVAEWMGFLMMVERQSIFILRGT